MILHQQHLQENIDESLDASSSPMLRPHVKQDRAMQDSAAMAATEGAASSSVPRRERGASLDRLDPGTADHLLAGARKATYASIDKV